MAQKDRQPYRSGYLVDIGIECHVQLKTDSKLFCGCSNDARAAKPNTTVCPVCLGMPGTLPVLNKRAVELAMQAGSALDAEIAGETKFDRKNYFYPDLPKGYQITQYDQPIVGRGAVDVSLDGESFQVGITRAHMEEDAGKLTHPEGADYSLVDLNRAGTPLIEIVSEPDIHSPAQAKAYAQELYFRMLYAGVSDVDMYHGNMRFDLNISVRKPDSGQMGVRTETKNLNSFRSIEAAAEYEIGRQIEVVESGGSITQETRGWDESKTYAMRSKEEADDYRYFPEPDIPPLVITEDIKQSALSDMPTTLSQIRQQFDAAKLSQTQQEALLNQPKLARLQQEIIASGEHSEQTVSRIANWMTSEVVRLVRDDSFDWDSYHLDEAGLVELAAMVDAGDLSSTGAKKVLNILLQEKTSPKEIAQREQLLQVSDSGELEQIVDQVIADNSKAADDVRGGESKAIGFLTGQVMKASQGRANPQKVNELLREKLQG